MSYFSNETHQALFVGKVVGEIGVAKTMQLLEETREAFLEKSPVEKEEYIISSIIEEIQKLPEVKKVFQRCPNSVEISIYGLTVIVFIEDKPGFVDFVKMVLNNVKKIAELPPTFLKYKTYVYCIDKGMSPVDFDEKYGDIEDIYAGFEIKINE